MIQRQLNLFAASLDRSQCAVSQDLSTRYVPMHLEYHSIKMRDQTCLLLWFRLWNGNELRRNRRPNPESQKFSFPSQGGHFTLPSTNMHSMLLLSLLLLLLSPSVSAHGMLSKPMARNLQRRVDGLEYCPHCLSGGGPAVNKVQRSTFLAHSWSFRGILKSHGSKNKWDFFPR